MDYQVPAGGIPILKTKKYEPRCKINKPFKSVTKRVDTKRLAVLLIVLATAFLANVPTAVARAGDSNSDANADNPHVLLISSVVEDADLIAKAAKTGVRVIAYDAEQASLNELLESLRESLQGKKAASVGIVAHDYGEAKFYLTGGHTISLNSTLNSPEQRSFARPWKHDQ